MTSAYLAMCPIKLTAVRKNFWHKKRHLNIFIYTLNAKKINAKNI